jgi:hypothetical protein
MRTCRAALRLRDVDRRRRCAISIPFATELHVHGLVTVAPFFGSTKNTRGFVLRRRLGLPALPRNPNPATRMRTGSTSCFPIFISDLLLRGHILSQSDGLFESHSASNHPAPLPSAARRRLERQDPVATARQTLVRRQRDQARRAPAPRRDVGAKRCTLVARQRRCVLEQQDRGIERDRAAEAGRAPPPRRAARPADPTIVSGQPDVARQPFVRARESPQAADRSPA